jgi:type IV secretion system protein VirB1
VAPQTLVSIVRIESRFNTLAIGGPGKVTLRQPRSLKEAVSLAGRLIRSGKSVDLGLAQINSRNLKRLGLSVQSALDPCRNLAAAGALLVEDYRQARTELPPQAALRRALSLYNSGSPLRGLANGYVARVEAAARSLSEGQLPLTPTVRDGPELVAASPRETELTETAPASARPPPTWDVFAFARLPRRPDLAPAGRPIPPPLLVFSSPEG